MFDERHLPYEHECIGCEATATVTHEDVQHEDVQDVPAYFLNSTVVTAVNLSLQRSTA